MTPGDAERDTFGRGAPSLTHPSPGSTRGSRGREGWGHRPASWIGRVRHVSATALIALCIAGCGSGGASPSTAGSEPAAPSATPAASEPGPLPPTPTTPSARLRVGFGGLVDTIEVSAVEYLPLREAMLVAPDGTIVPATYITVGDNPRLATGQWSLAQRWDNLGNQDNALAAMALHNAQAGAALLLESAAAGDGVARRHSAARSGRLSPRLARVAHPAHLRHAAGRTRDPHHRRSRAAARIKGDRYGTITGGRAPQVSEWRRSTDAGCR